MSNPATEMMGSQLKSVVAAATTGTTAVLQCVLGFTAFGSKLGNERTLAIAVSAAAMIVVIAAWAITTDGDIKGRRRIGLAGLIATLALALFVLWATFTYHNVLVNTRRVGPETITTLRGPLAPVDVHIEFYTRPIAPIAFAGYGGTSAPERAGVERFSNTKFSLHQLSSDKAIVLHHVSTLPILLEASTDGPAELTTRHAIWRKMVIAAITGGMLCGGAALLVWWFTPLQRSEGPRVQQIGFRTPER